MLVVGTVPVVGSDHASVRPHLVPHRSVADLSLPPAGGGPADPLLSEGTAVRETAVNRLPSA